MYVLTFLLHDYVVCKGKLMFVNSHIVACARHDNRTEVQAKDVKFLRDMDVVFREYDPWETIVTYTLTIFLAGRMYDRIDDIVTKVEGEEAAKTRKD